MLPKANRLTSHDITSLSQGKSVFGTLISLRFRPADKTKVSVTVSKKVEPTAVGRNRLRRKVYSIVAEARKSIKTPIFGLILPKKECKEASSDAIATELSSLFNKASK